MKKIRQHKFVVIAVVIALSIMLTQFMFSSQSNAISNWGPDEADFNVSADNGHLYGSKDMRFVVDRTGAQAPVSVVAVYFRASTGSVFIKDAALWADGTAFGDAYTGYTTVFTIESYDPPNGSDYDSRAVNGAPKDITLTISAADPIPESDTEIIGGIKWYKAKVRAETLAAAGDKMGNSFEIRANGAGSLISYYSKSGNKFMIQDRGYHENPYWDGSALVYRPPSRLVDYHLKFGADCTINANAPAELRWFDDDLWVAGGTFQGLQRGYNYYRELVERNKANVETHRYFLNKNGTNNFSSTSGFTGDKVSGNAWFTAKPDHRYEWIIHNVQRNNAIQFQVPFDSIYYIYDCPGGGSGPWKYSVDPLASTPATTTTHGVRPMVEVEQGSNFTLTSTVNSIGGETGDDYQHIIRPISDVSNDKATANLGKVGGFSDAGHVFTGTSTVSMGKKVTGLDGLPSGKSRSLTATYNVNSTASLGEVMCFEGKVAQVEAIAGEAGRYTNPPDEQVCIKVVQRTWWKYTANGYFTNPAGGSLGETITVNAGSTVRIKSNVTHSGTMAGPAYKNYIQPETAGDDPKVAANLTLTLAPPRNGTWYNWLSEGALSGGSSASRTGVYTVAEDAPHNMEICFKTRATPANGTGASGTVVNSASTDTDICLTVYNERFDLSDPTATLDPDITVAPGAPVDIEYTVCNDDFEQVIIIGGVDVPLIGTGRAVRGPAKNVKITSTGDFDGSGLDETKTVKASGADQCITVTETVTAPADSIVGDILCTTVTVDANYGFSSQDPARLGGGGELTEPTCVTVGVQPYFHAQNSDIWAGGDFDEGTALNVPSSCAPLTAPTDPATAGIHTVHEAAGSQVDYAALATGDIVGFNSAFLSVTTINDLLTFANDPSLGKLSTDAKCIPNYFGLMKNAENNQSFNTGTLTMANLNNSANWESGKQYIKNGSGTTLTIKAGPQGLDNGKDITIIVDGDIFIKTPGTSVHTEVRYSDEYGTLPGWSIPSLVLVASGDIFIEGDIERVDAVLVAHGTVWTCADSAGVGITEVSSNVCDKQLVINGAVIANRINFMRTHGEKGGVHRPTGDLTLPGDDFSQPSEIINYSPEFYLANPVFKTILDNTYRISQTKDLPPIY